MAERERRAHEPRRTTPTAGERMRAREHRLAELQRQVGNRAVAAMVDALAVQRVKEGDGPTSDIGVIQQQLNAVGATPRLAVTGRFDAETTAATRTFQKKLIAEKVAGVTEDGIVDGVTHQQLKARAPSVSVSGSDTVVVGPGNAQVPLDPTDTHKQLKAGARGVAVKELQERLNSSGVPTGAKLVVDGAFGPKTTAALKQFQSSVPMKATGVADPATWGKLQSAGAATQGHAEFDWREEVEGVKNVGLRAGYDWKLSKTALSVTVGITFRKKQKNVDTRIGEWLADIKEIWSTFRAVNASDPTKTVDLDFEAKRGGKDHAVDVFQFDPSLTKKERPLSRSDSGTWYTIDNRRSMAPHEFGHLIGLADEYNRLEEHYVATTGEEPGVGDVKAAATAADAKKVAGDIKAKLPLDDTLKKPIAAADDKRWGANLAGVIRTALGGRQGGFSRFVAQTYAAANGGASVYADIQKAFNDKNVTGFQKNLSRSVTPFLYSNRGLMGTMDTTPATGGGGKAAPDHEHPIEPRHVQPFVNILAHEWALQTGKADVWKPERR